ncbi:hypothetical protein MFLAVUS_000806 [Mucor flavus]|uniref:Uncharacterized protein n=1 Tax=Mucor flavus TaxID=439312 RepID=A0ABP9YKP9_9FUNG
MPRTPIYPEVENFIILKKRARLEKVKSDSKKESSTTQTLKRKCKYTLSVPFDTFCNNTLNKASSLEKVKDISGFIREALFNAQLFVNFFILQHPTKLTNDFFDQIFWYTISRVIRGSSDKVRPILQAYKDKKNERPADQNLDVVLLTSSFVELSAAMNGSLFVPENGLKNYGLSLSAACETNAKVGCIKNLVYNHVYDQVLTHPQLSSIPVDILALFDPDVGNNLTSFLNPLILEVKNRISALPLSKESLNKEPFKILPALRHILEKYDDIY